MHPLLTRFEAVLSRRETVTRGSSGLFRLAADGGLLAAARQPAPPRETRPGARTENVGLALLEPPRGRRGLLCLPWRPASLPPRAAAIQEQPPPSVMLASRRRLVNPAPQGSISNHRRCCFSSLGGGCSGSSHGIPFSSKSCLRRSRALNTLDCR